MAKIRLSYTLVYIWKWTQMRKSKWLFVMEPLSWMLLFRNNESSQNGCQVVLPRIVLSDHFCSFGQMTSFILSIQSLTLHCDPLWIYAHLYLHLRSFAYTWAYHCRTPRLKHKNCCCTKWAKKSGGDKSTVASTKCQPSSCAVPGGKYL